LGDSGRTSLKHGGCEREIGEMEAMVVDAYGKNQSSLCFSLRNGGDKMVKLVLHSALPIFLGHHVATTILSPPFFHCP
jgi:hypothetical protein